MSGPRRRVEIPVDYIRERLTYDPDTGELRWKVRPGRLDFNKQFAGKIAGHRNRLGYVILAIKHEGQAHYYGAHRVAFAVIYGRWPIDEIDHKNGNPSDNRLVNLREATAAQNRQNMKKFKNNSSGYTGVYRDGRRWKATAWVEGKYKHVGCFATKEEASVASFAIRKECHPFYARQEV